MLFKTFLHIFGVLIMESKIKYSLNLLLISGLLVFFSSCEKEELTPVTKQDEIQVLSRAYSKTANEDFSDDRILEIGSSDDDGFNDEKDLEIGSSDDDDFNGEKDLEIGSSDDDDFNGEEDLSIKPAELENPLTDNDLLNDSPGSGN